MAKNKGLGKGLDALFEDNENEVKSPQSLRLSEIEPNREQPRRVFSEEAITSLAESIREHGLIQPIIVRPMDNGRYQIVAGERRWRACRMLGMSEVSVIVKELNDFETAQLALIENIQREDLNPIEEATAYKILMDNFDMTQDSLSKAVGKSRSVIANLVRLLNLPESVQKLISEGKISVSQAKSLLAVADEKLLVELADKVSKGNITVRTIDSIVNDAKKDNKDKPAMNREEKEKKNYFIEMQASLSEISQRKVTISRNKNNTGTITIEFFDKEDLEELANKLLSE